MSLYDEREQGERVGRDKVEPPRGRGTLWSSICQTGTESMYANMYARMSNSLWKGSLHFLKLPTGSGGFARDLVVFHFLSHSKKTVKLFKN